MRLLPVTLLTAAGVSLAAITWACGGGEEAPGTGTTAAAAPSPAPGPDAAAAAAGEPPEAEAIEIGPGQPMEVPPKAGSGDGYASLEMHWGFTEALQEASYAPALLLEMDGSISIDDGDPGTREGIHLISALLFESGGAAEEGRTDTVTVTEEGSWVQEGTGYFYPSLSWTSATTTDWDGMAVSLRWEPGTDPLVTVEAGEWSATAPASGLGTLAGTTPAGGAGQTLEVGEYWTLAYKVYDLAMRWGYDPSLDSEGSADGTQAAWTGSLSVDQGGIYVVNTAQMETTAKRPQEPGDRIEERGDLDSGVTFTSYTGDIGTKPAAIDGVNVNIVAPAGSRPTLTLTVNGTTEEFRLPEHFMDRQETIQLDEGGHFVTGHIHWCWWKTPEGDGT